MDAMSRLRIGTCSWKYPSWKGLVYSEGTADDYLRQYAAVYDTVEVDQWFWSLFAGGKIRLPDPAEAEAYRKAVPDTFRFSVKAPNSVTLTHGYSRRRRLLGPVNGTFLSMELFLSFLDRIKPMHDVLGPIIFQFEYLNRQKMATQDAFEKALGIFRRSLPDRFTYAVEIRNGNYLNDRFFAFLEHHALAPVLLQGYWMPPVADTVHRLGESIFRYPVMVIRLHGPDRGGIESETGKQWNTIVRPMDGELDRLASLTGELLDRGMELYINVNNHYEGSAPLTIARFRERLAEGAGSRASR